MKMIYKLEKTLRKGMLICMAVLCFGLFYPGLCIRKETVKVMIEESQSGEEIYENLSDEELVYSFLTADSKDIKLKSRLWETIKALFERNK